MSGHWRVRVGTALTLAAMTFGAAMAALQIDNNFHAVVPGEVYRSGQPSPEELRDYVGRYHIASVISLRGDMASKWHRDEVATAQGLGIVHLDFPMSARSELMPSESKRLIALMESAPKPLLIHCKAGADRSGLAAALYLAAVAKTGEDDAESQLSVRYGHIGVPLVGTWEMDQTFEAMEPTLGFEGS